MTARARALASEPVEDKMSPGNVGAALLLNMSANMGQHERFIMNVGKFTTREQSMFHSLAVSLSTC